MRIWPADCSSGIHITSGSSGTVPWRCSHARSDSVHAASSTLATSPPKAVLTVSRSAFHTEAKATARRSVKGAVNALRGSRPPVDGSAGAADSSLGDNARPAQLSAHRAQQCGDGFGNQEQGYELELENLSDHLGREFTHGGYGRTRFLGMIVAAPCRGSGRNSRGQIDAAPTPRSLSSGDRRTTSAHRPPDRPSRVHASQSISL